MRQSCEPKASQDLRGKAWVDQREGTDTGLTVSEAIDGYRGIEEDPFFAHHKPIISAYIAGLSEYQECMANPEIIEIKPPMSNNRSNGLA